MVDVLLLNPPKSRREGDQVLNTAMLWLASALLERGRSAVVRMPRGDRLDDDVAACLSAERPRYVAIACKWWNTLHGATEVARAVRRADGAVPIVTGGHTASAFAPELIATGLFDVVLLGDVDSSLPCLVEHGAVSHGWTAAGYHPRFEPASHRWTRLDDVRLAPVDRLVDRPERVPGYVWTGRGCSHDCFYCLENRASGRAVLGRDRPVLRDPATVAQDLLQLRDHTQLILDYEHPSPRHTEAFMAELVERLPARLSRCYYFDWGLPSPALLDLLSARFDRVGVCLDLQSFAESHRRQLAERRLIKPFFGDAAVDEVLAHAARLGNVDVDASGVVGMPYETAADREQAIAAIERRMRSHDCVRDWRFSPLHVIPGTPLAANERFHDLDVVRRDFASFLDFTREAYEGGIDYYDTARRLHPYGVHPHGRPREIVDFMVDAGHRLSAARAARQRSSLRVAGSRAVVRLDDPYTPLAALFRLLDQAGDTVAADASLRLELGPRTWFHGSWTDYTSESGENSAVRCKLGDDPAALHAALLSRFARFRDIALADAADRRWGIVAAAARGSRAAAASRAGAAAG